MIQSTVIGEDKAFTMFMHNLLVDTTAEAPARTPVKPRPKDEVQFREKLFALLAERPMNTAEVVAAIGIPYPRCAARLKVMHANKVINCIAPARNNLPYIWSLP